MEKNIRELEGTGSHQIQNEKQPDLMQKKKQIVNWEINMLKEIIK